MPPIDELTRIEPVLLERLEHQGIFTTGLLLEVSETPTRRQTLADQVKATPNDVLEWRDEALMLNLAGFGEDEHQLLIQARIEGLARHPRAQRRRVPRTARPRGDGAEGGPTERPDDPELVGSGAHARRGVGAAESVLLVAQATISGLSVSREDPTRSHRLAAGRRRGPNRG